MSRDGGFTLVELMIVVSMIGVIAALAYPSFQHTIRVNRVQSEASDLLTALITTRAESIKSNSPAIICRSADGSTCAASGGWHQGYIVFVDNNPENDAKDVTEEVVRISNFIPDSVTITATTAFETMLRYRPDGSASGVVGEYFKVCVDNMPSISREIFVDATGRPRVSTTDTAGCDV